MIKEHIKANETAIQIFTDYESNSGKFMDTINEWLLSQGDDIAIHDISYKHYTWGENNIAYLSCVILIGKADFPNRLE